MLNDVSLKSYSSRKYYSTRYHKHYSGKEYKGDDSLRAAGGSIARKEMITFCDIHHHCLYGLDDGAQSVAEMEQMLHAAYRDYIDTIVVTAALLPRFAGI